MSLDPQPLWNDFSKRHTLTQRQLECFKEYYHRLVSANALHNLTRILDIERVIEDHFNDSLALKDVIDCTKIKGLCDIGTGGGFPGIPLKILYPELPLVLIEVNGKKRAFLAELVSAFGLTDTIISELDWRTFLRNTDYQLDVFTARASLAPDELIRMFMSSSPYKNGTLFYWASSSWESSNIVAPYIRDRHHYQVDMKERVLVKMAL